MKVGELYIGKSWSIFGRLPALYLGEDIIERSDGRKIINYAFWVDGKRVLADRSLISYLEPLTSS
jgi:hypothetical protein